MPNWIYCQLRVSGAPEELDAFRSYVGSERDPLDFQQVVPMSLDVYDADDAVQIDWCVSRWGTKWGPRAVRLVRCPGMLVYLFRTAWSFPTPVVERLREMFPAVTINGHAVDESGDSYYVVRRGRVRRTVTRSPGVQSEAEPQETCGHIDRSPSARVAAGLNEFGDWFVPLVHTAKGWCLRWRQSSTSADEWVDVAEGWARSCFLGSAADLASWAADWVTRDWHRSGHRLPADLSRRVDWAGVALDMKAAGDIFSVNFRDGVAVFDTCKDVRRDR